MAVPTYSEDLTDITLAESTSDGGTWAALQASGGAGIAAGIDFAMQGTNCIDKQVTGGSGANKGQGVVATGGVTFGADDHVYTWLYVATSGITNSLASEGVCVSIGTDATDYISFHVDGNDTYGSGGRVGKCYPVRYVTTTSTNFRTLYGATPSTTPAMFGGKISTTSSAKGVNFGVDAIRYGTGAYVTVGALATPGTFTGFAAVDQASTARWGICQEISGVFELQGWFVVGQNNVGTATEAYFDDTGSVMTIVDTPHSLSTFSQIIVDHASTTFNLTDFTLISLGTNNPGRLVFNDAGTTSALTGCTFNTMGISTLRAGVTATTCKWNVCDQITQNGATITGCTITSNSAASAIISDDIQLISGSNFTSDGTGHAIEYAPVGAGPFTRNYTGNTDTGYAATDGSTGNETILIHPTTNGADITLNIVGGSDTPTIMEHADYTGTLTISISPVPTTVNVDDDTPADLNGAKVLLLVTSSAGGFPYDVTVTATSTGTTASIAHTAHGLIAGDSVQIKGAVEEEYNGVFPITNVTTNAYDVTMNATSTSPATGTLKCTFAVIGGLDTAGAGTIAKTYSYAANQPVTGWVRKSSGAPYFKTAPITGTIDKDVGLTINVQMIPDE